MGPERGGTLELVGRKPRMQRVQLAAPFRLTASQREILQLLFEYNFLTPRLLALAYGAREGREGRGYWHLQRELRRLFDAGLVQRFPGAVRPTRAGSAESVYAISSRGGRLILDAIDYGRMRHELYCRENKHRANYSHHVAVATLQLILTLGQSGWRLIDFRAEDRDPAACIRGKIRDRVLTAWPDGAALIEVGGTNKPATRLRYLFEIDLTRKNNQRTADRFLAYAAYAAAQRREPGASAQRPAPELVVVFVVTAENELERFLEIAGEALTEYRLGSPPFLFWNAKDWFVESAGVAEPATLRPPVDVLRAKSLATLTGTARRLVEGDVSR